MHVFIMKVLSMVALCTIPICVWANPWGGYRLVSPPRDGKSCSFTRNTSSSNVNFDGVGLSWVSRGGSFSHHT